MKEILITFILVFAISLIAQDKNEKPLKYKDIKKDEIKPELYHKKNLIPDSIVKKYNIDVEELEQELTIKDLRSNVLIDSIVKIK